MGTNGKKFQNPIEQLQARKTEQAKYANKMRCIMTPDMYHQTNYDDAFLSTNDQCFHFHFLWRTYKRTEFF